MIVFQFSLYSSMRVRLILIVLLILLVDRTTLAGVFVVDEHNLPPGLVAMNLIALEKQGTTSGMLMAVQSRNSFLNGLELIKWRTLFSMEADPLGTDVLRLSQHELDRDEISIHEWTKKLCGALDPTTMNGIANVEIHPRTTSNGSNQFSVDDFNVDNYEVLHDNTVCRSYQLRALSRAKLGFEVRCAEVLRHRRLPFGDNRSILRRVFYWTVDFNRESSV